MQVKMELDVLNNIIQQAASLGVAQYIRATRPEGDRIKQREAVRYIREHGFAPKVLEEWVQCGYVHRRKIGERNSAVYYSLAEIQRQIAATEAKKGNIEYIIL